MTRTHQVPHPSELSAGERRRVARQSKKMFGQSDRLLVAVAVALSPDGVANATDLQWELHLAANRVRAQLLTLADLGVLSEGQEGLKGRRMFVRRPSPFWAFCLDGYAAALR